MRGVVFAVGEAASGVPRNRCDLSCWFGGLVNVDPCTAASAGGGL